MVGKKTKTEMKKILKEIQTGKFTKEWVKEYKGGLKNYNRLLKAGADPGVARCTADALLATYTWRSIGPNRGGRGGRNRQARYRHQAQ